MTGVRRLIKCFITIARQKCQLEFNHRCKEHKVLTPSLYVKPHIRIPEGYRLARRQAFQNLNLRILANHQKIRQELVKMVNLTYRVHLTLSEDELAQVINYAEDLAQTEKSKLDLHLRSKFSKLFPRTSESFALDKSKWVINLSSTPLTVDEENLLRKGPQFAIVQQRVPTKEILASIESNLVGLPDADKTRLRVLVSDALRASKPHRPNLTKAECDTLKKLRKDCTRLVLRADKGAATVVIDRDVYNEKVYALLTDPDTYIKLKKDPTKCTERKMNKLLLDLKKLGKFTDSVYFNLRSTDAICARLYGLPKVHKPDVPLRPIVSFVNSPTYDLSKLLCNILTPLTNNSVHSVKNSFVFAEFVKTVKYRPGDVMISCDVKALFTSVPIPLALSVVEERLKNDDTLSSRTKLSVSDIVRLLDFCLNACDFMFNSVFYHQAHGCPMGSPVSVPVANLVMEHVENQIFSANNFNVLFWRRYVDDTWVVLPTENASAFVNFINSIEESIQFTVEFEDEQASLPFLDVIVKRDLESLSFETNMYTKPTASNRYLPFSSCHHPSHKRSVVRSLTKRAMNLPSDPHKAREQMSLVKNILLSNGYPLNFIHKNSYCENVPKDPASLDHRRMVTIPYYPSISEKIGRILGRFDFRVSFKPITKMQTILSTAKDPIEPNLRRGVVYQIPCGSCPRVYIGQTGNSFITRLGQHRSALRLSYPQKSAVAEHAIEESHNIDWESAKVIDKEDFYFKRLFLEAWHCKRHNSMNRCDLTIPAVYNDL